MNLVELGRYAAVEATIIVGRLQSEGIDAVAFDTGISSVYGNLGLFGNGVRVMVSADDLPRARAVLDAAAR